AIPVARQTATTPPRPAACASLAANKRRPRSSKNGTNASKRALIAETSITPQEYLVADQHDTVSPDSFRAFFTPSGFFYSDSVIRTQVLSVGERANEYPFDRPLVRSHGGHEDGGLSGPFVC